MRISFAAILFLAVFAATDSGLVAQEQNDRVDVMRSVLAHLSARDATLSEQLVFVNQESPIVKFIVRDDGRLTVDGRDAPPPEQLTSVLPLLLAGLNMRPAPVPGEVSGCAGERGKSRCAAARSHTVLTLSQPSIVGADEAFISVTQSRYAEGRTRPSGFEEAFLLRRTGQGWSIVRSDTTGVM